jgi:NADH:ubiquinone oxidoreductase subunit 4 (subunit M)
MTTLLLLLAGFFLPLYPLSIGANLLLQSGAGTGIEHPGPWSRPLFKAAAILLMPLIGVWLLRLGLSRVEGDASGLITVFAVWGGATSVLYAFRLLSTRDGQIWIGQLYSSALALIWVGTAHGVAPLLPALGLAVSLLPLLFLMGSLTRRFGVARIGLYPGLGVRMPLFSALFVVAVLVAVAVPFSPGFFAVADLAFGGVGTNELMSLAPLSVSWLLWTWAGVNLLTGIVFGPPRDDLVYDDILMREVLLHGSGMLVLAIFGVILVERVL